MQLPASKFYANERQSPFCLKVGDLHNADRRSLLRYAHFLSIIP